MPRFSAGITTAAGSSTLPIMSIYGIAGTGCRVVEIGVFNTTTTSLAIKLVRLSTAGTSSAITAFLEYGGANGSPALCTPRGTHSSTPPTITESGYFARIGAAIGAGAMFTFGDTGLIVDAGTGSGLGVIPTGTGQICDVYFVWEE